ncbi:hypothetical protein [Chitinophaga sp. Cy-1792]|uniref:hypothetical protein n=1 Tax=Chitinophaga sp. Cy-1792 TaxID=2608339 RepID=UPI001421AADD|nr:hypothetical protein [Chitinophaga sp. Cy-1792]NIG57624.1 hypothetical protein [Chitinophaga sp. Cy-1792]
MRKVLPGTCWLLTVCCILFGSVTHVSCNSRVQQVRAIVMSDDLTPPEMDTMRPIPDTIHAQIISAWNAFDTLEGRYPEDVDFLNKEPLKSRLTKLLGDTLGIFTQRFQVTPPLEEENEVLFDEGYEPGFANTEAAAVAIDMQDDIIYAGVYAGHQLRIFSERGDTHYPKKLQTWIKKFKKNK